MNWKKLCNGVCKENWKRFLQINWCCASRSTRGATGTFDFNEIECQLRDNMFSNVNQSDVKRISMR